MQQLKQNIPEAQRANPFRRAWNHLTDWEKSPVLKGINDRRMRKAERLIREQKWRSVIGMRRAAVPALIKSFEKLGQIKSMDIVWTLVGIGTPAIHGLVGALKDEDENVRAFSAKALAEIAEKKPKYGWKEFFPAIEGALLEEEARGAKGNLAELLGRIGDTGAVDSLITVLKDGDAHVIACASRAFAKMGRPGIEALIGALGNEDPKIRAHAARATADMRGERNVDCLELAVPALIGRLGDGDHEVQKSASDALRWVGDSSAIVPLYELMVGTDAFFLEVPAGKFVELMREDGVKAGEIIDARTIIASTALALADIAGRHPDYAWEPMVPGFLKLVESNDAWLQQIASDALGTIAKSHPEYEWKEAASKIARTLCVDRGNVRTEADKALVKMGMVSAKPLIHVMNNEHASPWAAKALKELAKKHAEEVAEEIVQAVNGNFGEDLKEISTGNGMAVQNLSDVLLECGKAMENAE